MNHALLASPRDKRQAGIQDLCTRAKHVQDAVWTAINCTVTLKKHADQAIKCQWRATTCFAPRLLPCLTNSGGWLSQFTRFAVLSGLALDSWLSTPLTILEKNKIDSSVRDMYINIWFEKHVKGDRSTSSIAAQQALQCTLYLQGKNGGYGKRNSYAIIAFSPGTS